MSPSYQKKRKQREREVSPMRLMCCEIQWVDAEIMQLKLSKNWMKGKAETLLNLAPEEWESKK